MNSPNGRVCAASKGTGGRGVGSGGGRDRRLQNFKMIMEIMEIVFSFSRRDYKQYALSMPKLNFNTDQEKSTVEEVFSSAVPVLSKVDSSLNFCNWSHSVDLAESRVASFRPTSDPESSHRDSASQRPYQSIVCH